ncbi:malto-oligosyltrehalose synthase [Nocardioides mangrovicus]|uniref:Malto-oligosyltrehalose synthase n=1 Tax=Nocardioides mangrovicus TaxID=2478913 RepID=A0A3L8P2W9_9ACTN|nr:malto-oligosyltrehalose synthase [Nocardioides mangrovicus]RLV48768.1 malto-oligosyltrehalose synthase [Nocardioides mangrovicus]
MTGPAPASTYRIQVTAEFDLFATARLLPYLHDLGVDWVYLSPVLQAEAGSSHGYDVVDPSVVDASRGGPDGLAAVSAQARELGMGVLVDVVPNHLGVESPGEEVGQNAWWASLLKSGEASPVAGHFDVDWAYGQGRLVLPDAENGGDLNYRRFFTVSGLAGVRVEDEGVFAATHGEIERWFAEDLVDGLRIDHPDGLRDPRAYLDDLAAATGSPYVLVEKILEEGEVLPADWATAGTTGYEALAAIDRVLTDPAVAARPATDWHELIHDTKREVADGALHPEVARIVRELRTDGLRDGAGAPAHPASALEDAVAELLACFPVYRSYLPEGREHLDQAFAQARRRRPDLPFDDLEPLLSDASHPAALRLQQTSGMVMAKGVEDCAFYRYARLTSLTEVGGDPSVVSLSLEEFHRRMAERQRERPDAMTTSTTHDTKRGEDTRARIAVLAEMVPAWDDVLSRLQRLAPMPDAGFADLVWQAVVGAWPISADRMHAYVEKAMREAGDHTGWLDPDEDYERAVHRAVDAAYEDREVRLVLDEVLERVAGPGWSNALAAKLLTLTVPGVPDVYQGSELWEQSLVDPDNRRPVDFAHRAELLAAVRDGAAAHLSDSLDDPAVAKLLVAHRALTLRRDRPELFGGYTPLVAGGSAADHVLAFDRGGAITVVTRLPLGLGASGWGDTEIELPDCVDTLTGSSWGGRVRLADLLATYPVALLERA